MWRRSMATIVRPRALEAAHDLADETALDRVGLAEDQRAITHRRQTLVLGAKKHHSP